MSDRLLHTKVSKRKPLTHFPKKEDGHDGDMQIVSIKGKGTYLCIKDKSEWKISEKFNPRNKFDTHIFDEITTRKIRNSSNLMMSFGTISGTVGGSSVTLPITRFGDGSNTAILSTLGSQSLSIETGISPSPTITIKSTGIFNNFGTANLEQGFQFDHTSAGKVSIANVSGDSLLELDVTAAKDRYIRFKRTPGEGNVVHALGVDQTDSKFKLTYSTSAALTVSDGTTLLAIDTSGNTATTGTLTIGSITTDTAGDNYLVEVSGVVKKRTPAETLADIGAQATVTAGTNCTFSGATSNVDDAFIKNDANDTMAGTLAITSTTADQFKVLYDASNYANFNVSSLGGLEIETVGAGDTDSDITLNADGDILMDAAGEVDFNTSTAGFTAQTGTDAVSIDWGEGNKYHLLLDNSSTVTFATNPSNPCNLILKIVQGNGGSNVITWAVTSGTIYWAGGGILNTDEPTLTTTDDKTDILSFYFDGTNYYGVASLDFDTT